MFPREEDVAPKHTAPCEETIVSGKHCRALGQVWCGLNGLRFRTYWLWQGVCLTSGQEPSPVPLCSAGSQNFYSCVVTRFCVSGVPSFLQALPIRPIHLETFWSLTASRKSLFSWISLGSFHLIRSSLHCLCPASMLAPCPSDSSPD